MAQNHNCYAIIGNNGYGLSSNWEELISYSKFLQNEWHKGFQTEEDAYNWLVDQCSMRSRLNAFGMCDLATLRSVYDTVKIPAVIIQKSPFLS